MTQIAWIAFAVAIVVAAVDWFAVARNNLRLRWASKPGTIAFLIAAAVALHPASGGMRSAFVVALLLSLVGDTVLLLGQPGFNIGLGAFLAAHIAFCVGFVLGGLDRGLLVYATTAVVVVSLAVGGRIIWSVLQAGKGTLALPVGAYLLALAAMVALAGGSARPAALAGAALSYASDGLIAWNQFVKPLPWSPLPVIVTYHVGQALLVLALAS